MPLFHRQPQFYRGCCSHRGHSFLSWLDWCIYKRTKTSYFCSCRITTRAELSTAIWYDSSTIGWLQLALSLPLLPASSFIPTHYCTKSEVAYPRISSLVSKQERSIHVSIIVEGWFTCLTWTSFSWSESVDNGVIETALSSAILFLLLPYRRSYLDLRPSTIAATATWQ